MIKYVYNCKLSSLELLHFVIGKQLLIITHDRKWNRMSAERVFWSNSRSIIGFQPEMFNC